MKINLSRKYLLLYLFLTIIPFSTWAAEDLTEQPSNENITLHEFLSSRGYVSLLLQKTIVGHFEAHVLVNGKKARFLIDTGASNTVVDHKSAAQYTLLIEDSNEAAGGGLGTSTQSVSTCIIDTLDIGPLRLNKFNGFVMDLSHVNQALIANGAQEANGIIGADILNDLNAIIDYRNTVIYLKEEK